jgi:TRAP-type C4-dicarboxylate transport system permease small subunit
VVRTQQLGQLTPALQVPMWIVYLAMPLAGVLLALRAALILSGHDSAQHGAAQHELPKP